MDEILSEELNRLELFHAIGAIVVAGGQVEWRLQRLLLWIRDQGPSHLNTVTCLTWTDLEKAIKLEAPSSSKATKIAALMQTATDQHLKTMRDNAVHAHWWTTEKGNQVVGNRHDHKGNGYIVAGKFEDLHQGANQLFQFAYQLAMLTPDDKWPVMRKISN
jgi:hypothetical protein